jgi:hypothetical protein
VVGLFRMVEFGSLYLLDRVVRSCHDAGMTNHQCESFTQFGVQCGRKASALVKGQFLCGYHHRVLVTGFSRKVVLVDHGDHAGPEMDCRLCSQ